MTGARWRFVRRLLRAAVAVAPRGQERDELEFYLRHWASETVRRAPDPPASIEGP